MKILVVNTAASEGGALSILTDFYTNIVEHDQVNEWVFILSDDYLQSTRNIKIEVVRKLKSRFNRLKFDFFEGHKMIRKYKPDVVFSMQNTILDNIDIPQVVYVHQPIPFQSVKKYSFLKRHERHYAVYQNIIGKLIKRGFYRVDEIIVQTQWMKNSIVSQENIEQNKITVIPPSINNLKVEDNIESKTNYFFYPTSDFPYKNLDLINKAADIIDSLGLKIDYKIELTVDKQFSNPHVISVGRLSRADTLKKLQSGVLLFPSYIETFGMPLAEARNLNTMILASDTEFSKEVLKNYRNFHLFNPFEAKELADLMIASMKNQLIKYEKESLLNGTYNSWDSVREILYTLAQRKLK